MKYTNSFVKNIFTDGVQEFRIDMQPIVNITFLLNHKLIFLKEKTICTKKIYFNYLDDIYNKKMPRIDIDGGGNGHLALKLIGNDLLKEMGSKKNKYEARFEGFVPDIISKRKDLIVECGNTNPDKIFYYFKNKDVRRVIIIPYPGEKTERIIAFIFTPSGKLSDFINFMTRVNLENIKKLKSR